MLWATQEPMQAGADITKYTQAFEGERSSGVIWPL